jgi:hypothetical protein
VGLNSIHRFLVLFSREEMIARQFRRECWRPAGLYAAATIRPGDEIYAHYGAKSYANLRIGYTPGAAAVLSKEEIPRAQLPATIYGASFPADALWAF